MIINVFVLENNFTFQSNWTLHARLEILASQSFKVYETDNMTLTRRHGLKRLFVHFNEKIVEN